MRTVRRTLMAAFCVAVLWSTASGVAQGAAPEPAEEPLTTYSLGLNDPCGIAVSASGEKVYFANYYPNSVEVLTYPPPTTSPPVPPSEYRSALTEVDPLDGPCGLTLDSSGRLYVNNYHRNVERYAPSGLGFGASTIVDSSHPTGVAVNLATDDVYVDARTYIARYGPGGAGPAIKIGEGSLGDGYGLAVSGFPATVGYVYVPDHADDTVKVYNPAIDLDDPIATIDGADVPGGGFGSLRDSAIATDNTTGEVYVVDTLKYPQYTEQPKAVVHVFEYTGNPAAPYAYEGRLKYDLIDSSPVGLAVDNSTFVDPGYGPSQGRVYVTSGNTVDAIVNVYSKGSAGIVDGSSALSEAAGPPVPTSIPHAASSHSPASREQESTASSSTIAQGGEVRIAVSTSLAPRRLPRSGSAPISVAISSEISTTGDGLPPQLKRMRVELNKNGHLDFTGLPRCRYSAIQPGSSARALSQCQRALVGKGSFTADITLAGQEPYPTKGKLLLFNGREKGKPVLYGHIYSAKPFATSFVIVFRVQKITRGSYGIALDAPLPKAMDAWGRLTGLQMRLSRRYTHRGEERSFLSAGCPAPAGFPSAVFPLARTEFSFAGSRTLGWTIPPEPLSSSVQEVELERTSCSRRARESARGRRSTSER